MKVTPDNILIKLPAHQVPHLNEWLAFLIGLNRRPIGIELPLLVDETVYASNGSFINTYR